ncbi:hypothetical protein AYL99_11904 [Fonsecaea erecta]|uniref:Uncharacterized protein n=1 Tax=Fonsecaea erecta TaxID=1367422 RepID=A0A178Z266_9EURO|nr:hypothetical protein AYL99_11904 [Fonsecaea erecta]OAP53882.1 hypothetical protein AYL99_11904 [Fonsecaea erecta]
MTRGRRNIVERAKQMGYNEEACSIVNGDRLLPKLEDGTIANHQAALSAWTDYVDHMSETKQRIPCTDNLEDLKDFVYIRAKVIKGTQNKTASVETVRNYWNNFTGAWKRSYPAIRDDLKESIHEFIYGPLKELLGLLDEKKPRRYANEKHLLIYAEQLWSRDWFIY